MPTVAFATYQHQPGINEDERHVAEILHERGIAVTAAVWDDPAVDWSRFDCVVIRSTWDYHLKPNEYTKWLQRFFDRPGQLWNPPQAVLNNINKSYLATLAEQGRAVVPTHYQRRGDYVVLSELLEGYGWNEAVIKPAVSASAHGTWRTSLATAAADQQGFTAQLQACDLLVQPYISEVAFQGEWSLIFFDRQFSHAALKLPARGDFRVQREFGGRSSKAEASARLISQAESVLDDVDSPLLYARVDGIVRGETFMLTELEINEPFLFLGFSGDASRHLANAICQKLPWS
jgi:glutathione synthase/RimK-type ligase-like ATP-grasp enzyme